MPKVSLQPGQSRKCCTTVHSSGTSRAVGPDRSASSGPNNKSHPEAAHEEYADILVPDEGTGFDEDSALLLWR
jgi:hypothetical protein